ncbi:MAG: DNA alkylation repair protein [Clostridia bacterium]|nr:DNA alkylation repair protein [Clostridia bacterium]
MDVIKALTELKDADFGRFQASLLPTVGKDRIIGVRTPDLRALAKEFYKSGDFAGFLSDTPHRYFEENNLHAFIICEIKDFDACLSETDRFLPYVDNWATCDQLRPRAFAKRKDALLPAIRRWMRSGNTYTVRFGVGMLMCHFLDGDFEPGFLAEAAAVRSDEYYVNMMTAWFFATALAKRYGETLPYIENRLLTPFVHNAAIRKACESFRVGEDRKEYLKTLKA